MDWNEFLRTAVRDALGPTSIFHWSYLLAAYGLALLWLITAERLTVRNAFYTLLSKRIWLTRSSRIDLILTVGFVVCLARPIAHVEHWAFTYCLQHAQTTMSIFFPQSLTIAAPTFVEAVLATLVTMLAIDLSSYVTHRAMHHMPILWRFHAVHHSATALTPLTTYRQHPLEPLLLNTARGVGAGIGLGLFYYVFPQHTPVITVSGLGAGFFVYMFTVNLHHAPVPLRYPPWLRQFLISPHVHHLHHSAAPRHTHRNYGVVFSWWDRMLATYIEESPSLGEIKIGLGANDRFDHSLVRCLVYPLGIGGSRSRLPAATTAHAGRGL